MGVCSYLGMHRTRSEQIIYQSIYSVYVVVVVLDAVRRCRSNMIYQTTTLHATFAHFVFLLLRVALALESASPKFLYFAQLGFGGGRSEQLLTHSRVAERLSIL